MSLVKRTKKPPLGPVERTVFLKEKLIKRLRSEISSLRSECEVEVKKIESRIQTAQMIIDTLKLGQQKESK